MGVWRALRLGDLAEAIGGRPVGDPLREVRGVCSPFEPLEGYVVFLKDRGVKFDPSGLDVGIVGDSLPVGAWGVEVEDLGGAWIRCLRCFEPPLVYEGVHPTAVIHPSAHIGEGVHVGPYCVIDEGAHVGDRSWLQGHVYVGRGAVVGEGCVLFAFSAVQDRCSLGNGCRVHSGAVIGCDGFGFVEGPGGERIKVPQIGTVSLGDRVEVGACSTVDRATVGVTRVMDGVKMDDHVHVAHNCFVGENSVLVAYAGLGGSSRLGRSVVMAAQSGVGDHVSLGDGCVVAARGGVVKDLPPGSFVSGFPARDHREEMRVHGAMRRLPDLLDRVRRLERELEGIKALLEDVGR
ncbi:MAG: UDP-3-O-(3-hydroxymyristoyl)glucosamine N-acyltransferase [Thermanaerothrix sp.]|nr:UDP-3-O-(3-hydroxymyristoyl)glucosamine N-acyltransferase [Thermanaerothrix sp.]